MSDLLKVTVDGREAMVPKGTLIVEAAKQVGIEIPVFCYHKKLSPVGACRMCLVEIEKVPRLQTACTTPVSDGMVVKTDTPAVDKARKGVLEFLLANHPSDCPACDKGGECPLQDTTFRYACDRTRFAEEKKHFEKAMRLSDRIVLDRERCIMCMRCVRFQREVAGDEAITLLNRGARSCVGTLPGRSFDSPFSGNTTELCPVGALTSAKFRFRARSWELTRTPSVCTLCGVGCNVNVETRNGEVMRLTSRENPEVDDGWLCDWGRFTYDFVNDPARLSTPLVRKDGELQPASWQEALEAVVGGLRAATSEGGESVAGLISPNATNEELFLFQKLFRTVLKSGNVDHGLHGQYTPSDRGVDAATGSMTGLESARLIVLAGVDPLAKQPVLDLRLKKAVKRGARLLVISDRQTDLTSLGSWLRVKRNSEASVIKGLLQTLLSVGVSGAVARERLGVLFDGIAASVADYTPELVEEIAGLDAAELERTAAALAGTTKIAVLYPRPVPGAPEGLREACEWLSMLTGGLADPAGGLFPLSAGGNTQGAIDMGALPGHTDLTGLKMIDAADAGRLKAMYMVGMDPAGVLDAARAALSSVEFLVVQDIFLTETAKLAHVVLPAASFAEKDGTLTNLERRVQRLNAALPCPGKARPDWEIIASIGVALGAAWGYRAPSDVFAEIAGTVSGYEGLGYEVLGDQGKQWGNGAAEAGVETPESRPATMWYQPLERETEPQETGA